ncbi:MAG: aldo/keto reductase [Verrucomicrobiia bacterium]
MKRRTFIKVVGVTTGSALFVPNILTNVYSASDEPLDDKELPKRPLGKTGLKISTAAFSGFALNKYEQSECNIGVKRAFDRGVNYFDVAPAYGESENRMGIALQGIDRSKYYLACKTKMRDAKGAMEELERSLKRLKTDHFDVYQLHHLRKPEEVQQALGPGGAMEAILKAKEQGKVRFIGFSAHTTKAALEAMKQFKFDTVMFPISFVEYYRFDFGKAVLEEAKKQGLGVLAIKAMSTGLWQRGEKPTRNWWYRSAENQDEVNLVTRFSLSFDHVSAIFAPSFLDLVDKAITAAKQFRPITDEERNKLKEWAQKCDSLFKREEDQVTFFNLQKNSFYTPYC